MAHSHHSCWPALSLLVVIFLSIQTGFAQSVTGLPPLGSFSDNGVDIINQANLNIHLTVPITHRAGRGISFDYALNFDNSIYTRITTQQGYQWTPAPAFGWRGTTEALIGYVTYAVTSSVCTPNNNPVTVYEFHGYHDSQGTFHRMAIDVASPACATWPSPASATAWDGAGYVMTVNNTPSVVSVYDRSGNLIHPPLYNEASLPANLNGAGSITDPNGNVISTNGSTFTDTLGTSALTVSGTNPISYSYPGPQGSVAVQVQYSPFTVATHFGCSPIGNVAVLEYPPTSKSLITKITLPDLSTYTFQYEPTPGMTGDVTGRISQVKLPTGGTIQYAYSGGNNGIICTDGTAAGLTRTTSDGAWQYTRSVTASPPTTTITDPAGNATVLSLAGGSVVQSAAYQGPATGTPLDVSITCYAPASNPVPCFTTTGPPTSPGGISTPLGAVTVTDTQNGVNSDTVTYFNSNDLPSEIDRYDNTTAPIGTLGSLLRKTTVTYASLGNIKTRPAINTVLDGAGSQISQATFLYDQGTVQGTSGTPQHVSVTSSRGNLTSVTQAVQGTSTLTRSFTYFDTGTVASATDVNGSITTYNYPDAISTCGNSFPTSLSMPMTVSVSATWDCNGGVMTGATDANHQLTTFGHSDPFWRVNSVTDPLNNVKTFQYSPNSAENILNFGTSTVDVLQLLDSYGRVYTTQRRQGPSATNADTTTTKYDSNGRRSFASLPFQCIWASTSCSSVIGTSFSFDALNRSTSIADSGGGTLSTSYAGPDILSAATPVPIGEIAKEVQTNLDGLGRLKSTCSLSGAAGSTTCISATGSINGFPTTRSYSAAGSVLSVTRSSSSATQSRSFTYDQLGRVLSTTYPESGATQFWYDTAPATPGVACPGTYNGDLVKKYDSTGNSTCYTYDALHRLLSVTYSGPNAGGGNKYFVYDSATVNGIALKNGTLRLVEAYTAATPTGTKITDVGYSYDVVGRLTDVYESTPHSGGYYHVNASFWANGALNVLNGGTSKLPGLPTITYGVDGEGRTSVVSASSGVNPVANTAYDSAGHVTDVTFGSADTAHFGFDPNTGRMTQYKATINGTAMHGDLTWNANGTLRSLAITDPFNASDAQTCNYGSSSTPGYDEAGRLLSVNCGSVWSQSFSYDAFGNITKSGSISWMPGYNSANNHYSLIGTSYDAKGNLLADTFHTYTWDVEGRPLTIDAIPITYDAFGRMVEENKAGTFTQFVYAVGQKLAIMNGQTLSKAFVPLPGATQVKYDSGGISTYRVPDWLGSLRIGMNPNRTYSWGQAFAPYGERYSVSGGAAFTFTGQTADTISDEYDFLYRELHGSQGRWISPDPAHSGWNAYAYVENSPLQLTDPTGLGPDDLPRFAPGYSPMPRPMSPYGSPAGGGGGMTCIWDGVETDCGVVQAALGSGAAVECPADDCSVFKTYTGSNLKQYTYKPTVNGPTWIAPNGDELDNAPTELGLPDFAKGQGSFLGQNPWGPAAQWLKQAAQNAGRAGRYPVPSAPPTQVPVNAPPPDVGGYDPEALEATEAAAHGLLIIMEILKSTLIDLTFTGPISPCIAYNQGCGSSGPPI